MGKLLAQTIRHFFPDMKEHLSKIPDPRKKRGKYAICDLVFAGLAMFMLKMESKNNMNNKLGNDGSKENYEALFGFPLPHMDTVDNVMKAIGTDILEDIRLKMVRLLLENKVLRKQVLGGACYLVGIDLTGIAKASEKDEGTIRKKSKNGKVTYYRQVLEAKIIIPGGFAISVCTEWLDSREGEDEEKQDCELVAFKRMAPRLKKMFPRLSICILVDGLYPNGPFFKICNDNDWKFCAVLRDSTLKSVWDQVDGKLCLSEEENNVENMVLKEDMTCEWVNGIIYDEHRNLSWIEACSHSDGKKHRFVYITNLAVNHENVCNIVDSARSRWKIEDAFNTQKNRQYTLKHKFSRGSFTATKNYYILMQIAHMINQLVEYSDHIECLKTHSKQTIKNLWNLISSAISIIADPSVFIFIYKRTRYRFRFN